MTSAETRHKATQPNLIRLAFAMLVGAVVLAAATAARGDSTPVGPLPHGPVTSITTSPNQLVAVALPRATTSSGLVWRIARRYDSEVVRQVSEANIGANVVLVYKVIGRGKTSLVFALTRGDASPKAIKSATSKVVSR